MAASNAYATQAELKAWLGITDTADDTKIDDALTAASRWIDGYCNRRFWKDTTDTVRTYQAECRDRLDVDDLVSITALKTDTGGDGTFETTWAASDYQLTVAGWNTAAYPETVPYDLVFAVGSYDFPISWSSRTRGNRVEITGIFGWPAVPADVKQACLIQSSRLFQRRQSIDGVIAGGDFGVIRVGSRLDPDVGMLLDRYRRRAVLVR